MRIHSNTLTRQDIYEAAREAGVRVTRLEDFGSRSHGHAHEVILSGSSPFRQMGKQDFAATWDEWGHFLAFLFNIEEFIKAGPYTSRFVFHERTKGMYLAKNSRVLLGRAS